VFTIVTQLAIGQQWTCNTYDGQPFEGLKKSSYNAYIPGDNIIGGSPCYYYIGGDLYPFAKHYKADGQPVQDFYPVAPARVMQMQFFQYDQSQGTLRAASETRAYGAFSPANGSTLSFADEDGVPNDCYLFHGSGYGMTNGYNEQITFPQYRQAQAHLWGTAANPLDYPIATIAWDVNVVQNYQDLNYVTAYANVTHTCFPAHVVQATNAILYHWTPPQNDPNYIFGCLVLHSGNISGVVTPTRRVPCNW
jgi:hypothetical protein